MRFIGPHAIGDFIGDAISGMDFFEFVVLNTRVEIGIGGDPDVAARADVHAGAAPRDGVGAFTIVYGVYHDRLGAGGHWWFEHRRYHTLRAAWRSGRVGRVRVPPPPPARAAVIGTARVYLQEISTSPPSTRTSRSGHSTHDHLTPRVPGRGVAMLPVLVGIVPTGLAVGAGLSAAGVPFGPGVLSAATVYGATSQIVLADGATRAHRSPHRRRGRGGERAPCLLRRGRRPSLLRGVDRVPLAGAAPDRAAAARGHRRSSAHVPLSLGERTAYFLGGGLTLWVAWQVADAAGMLLGSVVPSALALDAALPLCLVAIVAPALDHRVVWTSALVAGAATVALVGLPYGLGSVVGACVGIGSARRMVTR